MISREAFEAMMRGAGWPNPQNANTHYYTTEELRLKAFEHRAEIDLEAVGKFLTLVEEEAQ